MTMKHTLISFILLFSITLSATGTDRLYIENFNIEAGEKLQLPVLLLNDTAYSGLQVDLYLPFGLNLDVDGDEYVIDLTNRKDNSHTVASNLLDNGAIRIYISSVSAREFFGNNGPVMTLNITAANDYAGTSQIFLKNIICAEPIGTRHVLNDEICYVNPSEAPGVIGDVNGDGEVNIADINAVIDMILSSSTNLNGDVNDDGEINIADINAIIDLILSH